LGGGVLGLAIPHKTSAREDDVTGSLWQQSGAWMEQWDWS